MQEDKNAEALFDFTKNIKRDLSANNKKVTKADTNIKYTWKNSQKSVETKVIIELDAFPCGFLEIMAEDWLQADPFYLKHWVRYNKFEFDDNILTIICNDTSRLGDYYKIEITETI